MKPKNYKQPDKVCDVCHHAMFFKRPYGDGFALFCAHKQTGKGVSEIAVPGNEVADNGTCSYWLEES